MSNVREDLMVPLQEIADTHPDTEIRSKATGYIKALKETPSDAVLRSDIKHFLADNCDV